MNDAITSTRHGYCTAGKDESCSRNARASGEECGNARLEAKYSHTTVTHELEAKDSFVTSAQRPDDIFPWRKCEVPKRRRQRWLNHVLSHGLQTIILGTLVLCKPPGMPPLVPTDGLPK